MAAKRTGDILRFDGDAQSLEILGQITIKAVAWHGGNVGDVLALRQKGVVGGDPIWSTVIGTDGGAAAQAGCHQLGGSMLPAGGIYIENAHSAIVYVYLGSYC